MQGVAVTLLVQKIGGDWQTKDTDTTDSNGDYSVSWETWGVGIYLVKIHFEKDGYVPAWIMYPDDGPQDDVLMREIS